MAGGGVMEQFRKQLAEMQEFEKTLAVAVTKAIAASQQPEKTKLDRVWDVSTKLAVPLVLALATFLFNLNGRVSYIEATRFTALDHQRQMSEIEKAISAAAEGPNWMRTEIVSMNVKMDALKQAMSAMSERIVMIEAHEQRDK